MPLRFGPHDVQFERAPLTSVLCQVKFSPIYALLSMGAAAGFQDAIRAEFPTAKAERTAEVLVSGTRVEFAEKVPIWRFSDDLGWTVSIAIDFVALEATKYVDFQQFVRRLNFVLDAADRTLQPSDSTRIGLRKINALSHPDVQRPSDWAALLRSELVGLLGSVDSGGVVSGGSTETKFDDGEDGTLMVRHGVWNMPGADEIDPRFQLDLDYFTNRPYAIRGSEDLSALLQDYSDSITSFFTWSLRPQMYEYLGPTPKPLEQGHDGEGR